MFFSSIHVFSTQTCLCTVVMHFAWWCYHESPFSEGPESLPHIVNIHHQKDCFLPLVTTASRCTVAVSVSSCLMVLLESIFVSLFPSVTITLFARPNYLA